MVSHHPNLQGRESMNANGHYAINGLGDEYLDNANFMVTKPFGIIRCL